MAGAVFRTRAVDGFRTVFAYGLDDRVVVHDIDRILIVKRNIISLMDYVDNIYHAAFENIVVLHHPKFQLQSYNNFQSPPNFKFLLELRTPTS